MRIRATVVAALAGAALAAPAAPASAAACTQGSGVTVVVDFASLGGGTRTECAPGDPSTGLAALRGAGFTTTRVAQDAGYFVCRINGKPASDPCQRTPPANAYWSYWHARPGGSWTPSDLGAANYDPPRGSVEGWAFGAGKPPSSPPPQSSQPSPSPRPPASHPASPAVTQGPVVAARTTAKPILRSPVASVAAAAPSPAGTSASPSPVASARASTDPTSVTRSDTSRAHAVPWSTLVGIAVVLLIGAGAVVTAARRRQGRY